MDRRKARKSIAGGTTWKVYGTTLVLGLLLAAPLVQAQVTRIGAGEDEILRVKNEQAYANLEDRTHTLTHLTCEDIVVIVPWWYDGSGIDATFTAWIEEGGGDAEDSITLDVDGNGELEPSYRMCAGGTYVFTGKAEGTKSGGGPTEDSDQANVIVL